MRGIRRRRRLESVKIDGIEISEHIRKTYSGIGFLMYDVVASRDAAKEVEGSLKNFQKGQRVKVEDSNNSRRNGTYTISRINRKWVGQEFRLSIQFYKVY